MAVLLPQKRSLPVVGAGRFVPPFSGLLVVPWLHHEVCGTLAHPCHGQLDVGVCGEEHHGEIRMLTLDFAEPVEALVACVKSSGEVHVKQHDLRAALFDLSQQRVRRRQCDHLPELALQEQLERGEYVAVVIDDEDGVEHRFSFSL